MSRPAPLSAFLLAVSLGTAAAQNAIPDAIAAIRSISAEGKGNAAASAAWKVVAAADAKDLPVLLAGMDGANPLAKNWLQSAILSIGDRAPEKLPQADIRAFLDNKKHDQLARRLAYELLIKADPATPERMLPTLTNDPSPLIRRDAVQRIMDQASTELKAERKDEALKHFQTALAAAREEDQVRKIADEMKALGQKPDMIRHFGFLTKWKYTGPFHNDKRAGFKEVFAPENEKQPNFAATYKGKDGEVKWKDASITDEYGMLSFNKEIGMLKEVTAYAATTFVSDFDGPAEIRLGTSNAWKVWLNGEFVFGHDEYHRGGRIDQYKVPVQLKKGPNTILVKCCQNEEKETWTVEWRFQLRVSDENGNAIHSK